MKGILEFNLPEEHVDFQTAVKASDYKSFVWEFDQWLRSKIKYDDLTTEQYEVFDLCRKNFWSVAQENNITIEL
jgi:hypothetical protein